MAVETFLKITVLFPMWGSLHSPWEQSGFKKKNSGQATQLFPSNPSPLATPVHVRRWASGLPWALLENANVPVYRAPWGGERNQAPHVDMSLVSRGPAVSPAERGGGRSEQARCPLGMCRKASADRVPPAPVPVPSPALARPANLPPATPRAACDGL